MTMNTAPCTIKQSAKLKADLIFERVARKFFPVFNIAVNLGKAKLTLLLPTTSECRDTITNSRKRKGVFWKAINTGCLLSVSIPLLVTNPKPKHWKVRSCSVASDNCTFVIVSAKVRLACWQLYKSLVFARLRNVDLRLLCLLESKHNLAYTTFWLPNSTYYKNILRIASSFFSWCLF